MKKQLKKSICPIISGKRKKIWELDHAYHCSIIGTCMEMQELLKLEKKIGPPMEPGIGAEVREHRLHGFLVSLSENRSSESRLINKILDKKYRQYVRRYSKARSDTDIKGLWKQDMDNGTVQGAYWAAMTHPCISDQLTNRIYGAIHMMSHHAVVESGKKRRMIAELQAKAKLLEERLEDNREQYLHKEEKFKSEIKYLKKQVVQMNKIITENEELRSSIKAFRTGEAAASWQEEKQRITEVLGSEQQRSAELMRRIDEVSKQLHHSNKIMKHAESSQSILKKRCAKLEQEREDLHQEISSLETTLLSIKGISCAGCADCGTNQCPGPDLCGKRLLYVGGKDHLVPHYKKLVREWGGELIHHDGGREASMNRLPAMLSQADAVLCPIDCVSHDACNCAKRICKRYSKPLVMMRSAGISSLARGLMDIGSIN